MSREVMLLGLAGSIAGAAMAQPCVRYTRAHRIEVAGDESAVAIADFNQDGLTDVVGARYAVEAEMFVAFGMGDRRFTPPARYPIPASPQAIVAADFDGDGSTDVATAHGIPFGRSVAVSLNTGAGEFLPATRYRLPEAAMALAAGEVNGDGATDLLAVTGSGAWVLLGRGDGSFLEETRVATLAFGQHVAVADLNRDGELDAVCADLNGEELRVLLGTGAGAFNEERYVVGLGGRWTACGDVNADSWPDLVVVNRREGALAVMLNTGAGRFLPPMWIPLAKPLQLRSVELADLDLDGALDIVTGGLTAILRGLGDGTFSAPDVISDGNHTTAVALIDDADAYPDVAMIYCSCTDSPGPSLLVWFAPGAEQPPATLPIPYGNVQRYVDLNLDGALDLALSRESEELVIIQIGVGDGTFLPPQRYTLEGRPRLCDVGDVSHDGLPDIVVTRSLKHDVALLINNGASFESTTINMGHNRNPHRAAIADVNLDGLNDLAVLSGGSRR